MEPRRRRGPNPPPEDGHAWRPSLGYIALAAGIAAGGLTYLVMSPSSPPDAPAATATPVPLLAPVPAAVPEGSASTVASGAATGLRIVQIAPQERTVNGDPTPDLSSYVNPGEKPTMNEVITRLHQAGIETGLGAFSPPGTRPPMIGLAVPEDFVLPPGYVRHHQATDDGQRIEAILMFAPDREFFDTPNGPVKIPKDRVVPPELAPPGLAIRRIVIPAPIASAGPGS